MCHCYHGNQIGKFQFLVWYRYNTCVAIRLHVKSEGMANTLVTMETERQQFHKQNSNFESQLPWLPEKTDSFVIFCNIYIL